MGWMIPYDRLDAEQQFFLNNTLKLKGNLLLEGPPGTGKSVLLAHSLAKLLDETPKPKIALVLYTRAMIQMYKAGLSDLNVEDVDIMTCYEYEKTTEHYDYVVCDEVQDLWRSILGSMKSSGARKIIAAGDQNQSIYSTDAKHHCPTLSPGEAKSILSTDPFTLNTIYRLSPSLVAAVNKLCPNTNAMKKHKRATDADTQIIVKRATNKDDEVRYIWNNKVRPFLASHRTCAILLPMAEDIEDFANRLLRITGKTEFDFEDHKNNFGRTDYGELNAYLKRCGIPLQYLGKGYGDLSKAEKQSQCVIMTYSSAKGLDFENVFMPFTSSDLEVSREQGKGKTLFMVAMSRCRLNLVLTYSGTPHPYVSAFADPKICAMLGPGSESNSHTEDEDDDF